MGSLAAEHAGRPAIEIESLTKAYGRGGGDSIKAVDGVDLSIAPGQVFGLLGPNGAGKTTMIKLISGLVTPTSGSVRVNGYNVGRQRSRAVLQLGAVLEGGRNVYWSLTAWQNLFYFGRLKGVRGTEIAPRAEQLLRDLGLWDVRHAQVGGFSRGMHQKVAVSAALITDPPILLLDEPTIGLDVEAARTFKGWIQHLARDEDKTIVLTTHQLEGAQELSDRIAVIKEGEVIADLPTAELLARHAENRFEIRITGSLNGAALPSGARVEPDGDQTRVLLPDTDNRAVFAVLERLGATGSGLVSVSQARPSLEEVFIRLIHNNQADDRERARKVVA